jgi:flagella basal body P-ring formation protein FlgA
VAVASRPLAQGKTLSADDITMQRMDISRLKGGYLTQANLAIGQNLTRPVQLGQPFLSTLLKAPTIIRRGQTITMLAKQSTFEVRSMGESLMDGAVGQRIKVRNRHSRRVVEGVIAENGLVFVN